MTRIPHSATGHLRRMAPAGDHLDANLLSAFAEGALSTGERGQVMQHLATCADCRESVALAQPEPAEVLPEGREFGAWWLRWPFLRWAGLAASMAVVAGVLVLQIARQGDERFAAAVEEPSSVPVAAGRAGEAKPADTPQPASEAAQSADAQTRAKSVPQGPATAGGAIEAKRQEAAPARELPAITTPPIDRLRAKPAQPPARSDEGAQFADARAQKKSDQAFMRDPVVPPPPVERDDIRPATTHPAGGFVAGGAESRGNAAFIYESESKLEKAGAAKENTKQAAAGDLDAAPVAPPPPAAPQPGVSGELARLNEDQKVGLAKGRAQSSAGNPPLALGAMTAIEARWRLVNGELQRSFDEGRNWEDVPIAAEVAARAVDARAPVVWVAGDQRDLYQSSDNGLRWQRVQLPDALTGDVRELKARDRLRVDLTTSTGERWTTEDGGRTWTKK